MRKKKAKEKEQVFVFKVTINIGKGRKNPWRKIAILGRESLYNFARAIVESFDFYFDHCFGFYDNLEDIYNSDIVYELFTDIEDVEHSEGAKSVKKTPISQAFSQKAQRMLFFFDYGDCWRFIVKLTEIQDAEQGESYPVVLSKSGKAPEQYPEYDEV